jgi:hypothetical protein
VADGYVQVATDGSGKKIDNAELTREPETAGTAGVTVYRQRIVIGSDENPRLEAVVGGEAGSAYLQVEAKLLGEIAYDLRRIRELLELSVG